MPRKPAKATPAPRTPREVYWEVLVGGNHTPIRHIATIGPMATLGEAQRAAQVLGERGGWKVIQGPFRAGTKTTHLEFLVKAHKVAEAMTQLLFQWEKINREAYDDRLEEGYPFDADFMEVVPKVGNWVAHLEKLAPGVRRCEMNYGDEQCEGDATSKVTWKPGEGEPALFICVNCADKYRTSIKTETVLKEKA